MQRPVSGEETHSPHILLSIVIPFYNAKSNSARLLATLGRLQADDVEVICVDDGSSDGTDRLLKSFAAGARIPVSVIAQPNAGPGRARNAGLAASSGVYVWFVDCDDDIKPGAVDFLRKNRDTLFDVLDFNVDMPPHGVMSTMNFTAGLHRVDEGSRAGLVREFGAIWTKIFRHEFLTENAFGYPEFTFFEDNPVGMILPLQVETLLKVEDCWYVHHQDHPSITRQQVSARYFDRLHTAVLGLDGVRRLSAQPEELALTEDRFIDLFLVNTANQLFELNFPNTGFLGSLKEGHLLVESGRVVYGSR